MIHAMNTIPADAALEKINTLLDFVKSKCGLKNDAALSRVLGVAPPVISKTRTGFIPMGIQLMVRIHDAADMPLTEIRAMLGIAPLVAAHGAV